MPGVGDVPFLTNTSLLALEELPHHLMVVGGSYIGLEFAQMFRRFGSRGDGGRAQAAAGRARGRGGIGGIRAILEAEGITIRTSAECISLAMHDGARDRRRLRGRPAGDRRAAISCSPSAACPTPTISTSKAAGIATDERGYIPVDDGLATNVPGIWALGDCNGRGAFTHTAYNDFEIVAANLLDGEDRKVSDRIPAYALYIDPPLGRVGMTEAEARKTGRPLLVGPPADDPSRPRPVEKGETQGLMKVVVDADTRTILGAAILGTGGDEAIHGVLEMMNADQRSGAALGGADPPDRFRADPDPAWRPRAGADDRFEVLIVGAGHGGAQAAIALRQLGFAGSRRPGRRRARAALRAAAALQGYLAGEKAFERMLIRPPAFWAEREVAMLLGRKAVAVDPAAHGVVLADGAHLSYGSLIWAAGGMPRALACPGGELAGITIRSRADVERIARGAAGRRARRRDRRRLYRARGRRRADQARQEGDPAGGARPGAGARRRRAAVAFLRSGASQPWRRHPHRRRAIEPDGE